MNKKSYKNKKLTELLFHRIRFSKIYRILNDAWLHYARHIINFLNKNYLKDQLNKALFKNVETFCMFLGHRRSAHSIIGGMLDAHPNIVLSDELHVIRYIQAGFTETQIFRLIVQKSIQQAKSGRKKAGRRGKKYSYHVPHQWQGKYQQIKIIGDKEGGATTDRLASMPHLLQQLKDTIRCKIKFIIVIRNPYDNISTEFIRSYRNESLKCRVDKYFSRCHTLNTIRSQVDTSDILFLSHDDIISTPHNVLKNICRFLNIIPSNEYLDACAKIVYESPVKSRNEIHWPLDLIEDVKNQMTRFDFLKGYSFDD